MVESNGGGFRIILHVDLDAFYAQVEMVRLGVPRDKPLCVQQWEGVIAVNYPARKAGVSRMDTATAVKEKCPECLLVHVELVGEDGKQENPRIDLRHKTKVSLERYRQASSKIFSIITKYADRVERASIDEAYLDVTDRVYKRLGKEVEELLVDGKQETVIVGGKIDTARLDDRALLMGSVIANELRQEINQQLNYTCSAGIAHNKTLAKLASAMNKPNAQTLIPSSGVPELLESLPFKKIRLLGGKLGTQLMILGVETAGELQRFSVAELAEYVGDRSSSFVYNIVRGKDDSEVVVRSKANTMLAAKQFHETTWEGLDKWIGVLSNELHDRMIYDENVNRREARQLRVNFKVGGNTALSRTLLMPREKANRVANMTARIRALLQSEKRGSSLFPLKFLGLTAANFEEMPEEGKTLEHFFAKSAKNPSGGKSTPSTPSGALAPEACLPPQTDEWDGVVGDNGQTQSQDLRSDYAYAKRLQEEEYVKSTKKLRRGTMDAFLVRK